MTHSEILDWAREHHFPFLVLDDDEPLQHGEFNWHRQLTSGGEPRRRRVARRIEQWESLVNPAVEKGV